MPKRKRKNKIPYLVFLTVLVVVFVAMAIQIRNSDESGSTETDGTSDIGQIKETLSEEEKTVEVEDDEKLEEIEEKAIQYDGGSPNTFENLTGAINYINVNGDKLSIRVSIDQYLENGTCELVLIQDEVVAYQETVDIMGDATTSTCKGFDIPIAELNSGEVQFIVYLDSGDRTGEISGGVNL